MEQSKPIRLADMKDVPTKKSEEVFASDMVQKLRRRLVVMKDVPTMQGEEEEDYAVGMVPKGRITSADMKDAQIKLSREEYVSDMVLELRSPSLKDVPTKKGKKEYLAPQLQYYPQWILY